METKHGNNEHNKKFIGTLEQQNPLAVPNTERQSDDKTNEAMYLADSRLPYILDCYDGLLDELSRCGVLDQKQVQLIESIGNRSLAARQLLGDVYKFSFEKKEQFLAALDRTQQSHVSNYIRNNGQRPAMTNDDNWPITDEDIRVQQNWSKLLELMDSRNGLCNELLSAQCISYRSKEYLDRYDVMASRNKELLAIMGCKSREDFKKFIDCLIKTKQHHVAALLDPNIAHKSQPVDERLIASLIKNYSALVQLIDLKRSGLLSELLSADVITWYQKDFIESASTASQSNGRLFDCVKRGSQHDYDNFIKCLVKSGQQHVADLLRSNGVAAEIVAKTSLSPADEDTVVEEFFKFIPKTSTQKRQQLFNRFLAALEDNRLTAMQTEHSIKMFFICESLTGLLQLDEMFSTTKLIIIIQQLFTVLLHNRKSVNLRLVWNRSNYVNCLQHLSSLHGLPVYSHIHQLAAQFHLPDVVIEPHVFSPDVKERLPHELIELLIIKAAGKLFVNLTKMTSRADVYALTTLNSVCRYWWETLTYRRSSRQLLRQFFKHNCAPFRFNSKLVTSLSVQDCNVTGVAELDDKLYIVVSGSNTIRVWSRVDCSFCELEVMKVTELLNPGDMVSCNKTRCLYITDIISRCIWRVNLSSLEAEKVERFITLDYQPWKLSIQSNRLLVTENRRRTLCIYNCGDGALLKKIPGTNDDVSDDNEAQPQIDRLLRNVKIEHAVETSDGRLIVSYRPRYIGDTYHRQGVSEVTADGKVLHTRHGALGINRFTHLTVDSRNHILVCDYDRRQILCLISKLFLQQVLLTELNGTPDSLCYSEQTGLLYIRYYASPNIDVYKVTSS